MLRKPQLCLPPGPGSRPPGRPLALQEDSDKPVLVIGTFVEVHIEADEIESAVRLDRDHLHQGNTV